MKLDGKHIFFGIESTEGEGAAASQSELAYCGDCAEEVKYSLVFYGQLGHWYCPKCQHSRPKPDVYATNVVVGATSSQFNLTIGGKQFDCVLPLPGLFNVYNALAAAAARPLSASKHPRYPGRFKRLQHPLRSLRKTKYRWQGSNRPADQKSGRRLTGGGHHVSKMQRPKY